MHSISKYFLVAVAAVLFAPIQADATGFNDSIVKRPGFSSSSQAFGSSDNDPFKNAFERVDAPNLSDFYSVGTHTFSEDTKVGFYLLFEFGAFQARNELFVEDASGGTKTVFAGSDKGGDSTIIDFKAGEEATLKLNNGDLNRPNDIFSANDSENLDKREHFVGYEVQKDVSIDIQDINLFGGGGFMFDFLAGDLIIFIEDYLALGFGTNKAFGELDSFDNNDMVIVVRNLNTEVPEPGTMLLLSAGLLGAGLRRRKSIH